MTDATDDPAIRFAVIGVDHPHALELTGELLIAGAECVGWVETPGEPDGLFPAIFPDIASVDVDDALDAGIDLVVVAAVPNLRPDYAIAAMRSGADVLVAKPAATDMDQLAEIETTAASTGRRWWVAFTEHFTSRAVNRAHSLIADGRIGTVRHVIGLGPHRRGDTRPAWFSDPARSGPMLADLASHQLHHAATLLGSTDLSVVAARTTAAPGGTHPEILAEVMLEGGTGSAYCRVDWMTPAGLPTWGDVRLMITGDTGTIEVRSNCDPGGADDGDHLIVVDADGVERLDCRADLLTWATQLCADVRDGTEALVTTAHSLAVSRLALDAAAVARR
ncbi:MAG: Gfo/Idh/MocA family oxidoreductase [Acidimicrobiales bacterium]|nr:Gfo/Idh/MocA family oxidoreductase [Acidimicrobiales bacterium]